MILPGRPLHGSSYQDFCNVAAVPIANAVMQGHTSTISPISMKKAAMEERDSCTFSTGAGATRTVVR
ncbi:MAG TPA: hypothetical protein VIR34_16275 [Gemmatimonadaceae bacterium]|jgi:hypothetical protein